MGQSWRSLVAANPELAAKLAQGRDAQRVKREQRVASAREPVQGNATRSPDAVIIVSNCADSGAGSLRDAVASAVTGDTIDMTGLLCSTITLTSGAIAVSQDDLTIVGPGAGALTIDANNVYNVLNFYGTGTLSVQDVTLSNAYYYSLPGGAMWAGNGGDITLTDAVISNSYVYTYSGNAGGAAIYTYGGAITLNNTVISGNSAYGGDYAVTYGGAVSAAGGGGVIMTGSTISGNSASSYVASVGGGVYGSAFVQLAQSSIALNSASGYLYGGFGGGAYSYAGGVLAIDSTISGNLANANGGGVDSYQLILVNSTLSANYAAGFAGAGRSHGGLMRLYNSTITNNDADAGVGGLLVIDGSALLQSSIIFGNTAATGSTDPVDLYLYGTATVAPASADNLIGDGGGVAPLPADTISADPQLGPLADNGGPTLTHALGTGSPAINAGNNVAGLSEDQRGPGFPRVVGGTADIGSFETQGIAIAPPPYLAVPSNSTWALGLLGLLLGIFGWRRSCAVAPPGKQ